MTPREELEKFIAWIKVGGRVDKWDQEFFETWIGMYLKDIEGERTE